MDRRTLHWAGALIAIAVAGGLAWLIVDAMLAGAIGICTGVSALLALRIRQEYPDRVTGDSWTDKRWTVLNVAVVTSVALFGPMLVPVSGDYRFGIQLFVLLAAFVGYLAGSLAEMERDASRAIESDGTVATADD